MRLRAAFFGTLVVLVSLAGCNDDEERRVADPTCGGNTEQRLECAQRSWEANERTLAGVLAEARDTAGEQRQAFDDAQAKWAAYRDAFCEGHADAGGSIQPLNVLACKGDLTIERARNVCTWAQPSGNDIPPRCRALAESVDDIGD